MSDSGDEYHYYFCEKKGYCDKNNKWGDCKEFCEFAEPETE